MFNPYVGHDSQLYGVEEHQLCNGKGRGMRLYEVRNKCGLELCITPDRNGDIARILYKGIHLNYMNPCGYVAPAYYDENGDGFLRSFTAGFLTTCGLEAVGAPCVDAGEMLPMHGRIANQPAEHSWWYIQDENAGASDAMQSAPTICIRTETRDETLFKRKFQLKRSINVAVDRPAFTITDTIYNTGDKKEPLEILYHMNMGYPLLDEDAIVEIPSTDVIPRDEDASAGLSRWMRMEKPQSGYREQCFYHQFASETGKASIYQPKLGFGLQLSFDTRTLDCFTEWKMMGVRDYVLGLECGNCYPDGRDVMRQKGILKYLEPGESIQYRVDVKIIENRRNDHAGKSE